MSRAHPSLTNNEAEYHALLLAIELADDLGLYDDIEFIGDSKIVVCHINGEWQCRDEKLKKLRTKVLRELSDIGGWSISHTLRAGNKAADAMANHAMDRCANDY